MKKFVLAGLASVTLLLASCSSVTPLCATSNPVGKKVGEATGTYLFGILPLGGADSSIQSAAKNGGISKISTVDVKRSEGIFTIKITTIVTGE